MKEFQFTFDVNNALSDESTTALTCVQL